MVTRKSLKTVTTELTIAVTETVATLLTRVNMVQLVTKIFINVLRS
jgi:hypothetical protein